jgi:class 3 adenylate cyclase
MFADLLGVSALVEAAGEARSYVLVRECMSIFDAIVRRHGGAVDHHQGHALMAVFGVPARSERKGLPRTPDAGRRALSGDLGDKHAASRDAVVVAVSHDAELIGCCSEKLSLAAHAARRLEESLPGS